jgi:hypothetical protein
MANNVAAFASIRALTAIDKEPLKKILTDEKTYNCFSSQLWFELKKSMSVERHVKVQVVPK